jgi:subtilisin family serine protease
MSHIKKKHSVSISSFLLLFLAIIFPVRRASAVIYGDDDRVDYYECADDQLTALADDVVVLMVDTSDILCSNGDCTLLNLQSFSDWYLSEDPIGSGNPICIDEPFFTQPTAMGGCSGVLVGPDLILTPGHCVEDSTDIMGGIKAFVFDYHMQNASTPVTVFPEEDVYYGIELVAHSKDASGVNTDDWAIVRVDRPIEPARQPVPLRRSGSIDENIPLVVIGHPTGLPVKIDPGGWVEDAGTGSDYFLANNDTFGGNSGSGVYSRDGDRFLMEGIIVRSFHDHFETGPTGDCDNVIHCPDDGCPELETVVRATAFAEYIPYDYIVVFTDPNSKNDAVASATFPILHDYTLIPGFAAHLDYAQKQQLETNPDVVYIEPDLPIYLSELSTEFTPAAVTGEVIPDGVVQIGAPAVWPTTTGQDAVVCVLDTGLEMDHPDRPELIAPGWNFVTDSPDVMDSEGHGTHVAGTVAAPMGNDTCVVGVAPNARIMAVPFLDGDSGATSDAIAGIEYAVNNGAHVINASWGTPDYSESLYEAVKNAGAAGLLLIASAGDTGADVPHYPAAYDSNNIISVGASTPWGDRADFSNYGSSVDIVAPGEMILSTARGSCEYRSSTDMAVAHVTGTVAVLLTWKGSSMTAPEEIRKAMEQTAEDLGAPGRDDYYGHGLLNTEKALAYLIADGIPSDCAQVHDFGYGYLADLNNDCAVSLLDLELLAVEWLSNCDESNQWCNTANFNGSGTVSFADFATFCQQWLSCNDPQELNCSPCIPNWPVP